MVRVLQSLLLGACTFHVKAASVTPVEKVIQLLGELQKKVEQEGKDEAASYDKYSCFCKEESDNKLYAIETSTEKINRLISSIGKLNAEIGELDAHIEGLNQLIDTKEGAMRNNTAIRDAQHGQFVQEQKASLGAIDQVERAIKALKESKSALEGRAENNVLAQVSSVAQLALATTQEKAFSTKQMSDLRALSTIGQPGSAFTSKYHSNDIISTLEYIRSIFKQALARQEEAEFRTNAAYELMQQGLANEKKFAEKDKAETQGVRDGKAQEMADQEADKTQEGKEKDADQSFLDVLTANCEEKASLWDQRSQTRAAELQALGEAVSTLKSGVVPNYDANKKLVGLETKSAVKALRSQAEDNHTQSISKGSSPARATRAISFLQRHTTNLRGAGQQAVLAGKVQEFLVSTAKKLGSPVLTLMALKVGAEQDHFVKVRQLIKDLIDRLEGMASAEATQKSFCDTAMATATGNRDAAAQQVEEFAANIAEQEAAKEQTINTIARLTKEIAENQRALAEATELRQKESLENAKTVQEAGVGKEAVEYALGLLRQFYQTAFVQYVPPNSDRKGLTVGDKAPEVFKSEYHGHQEGAKGIIGLLEVIMSDFDRTGTTVSGQEQQAASDFTTFSTDLATQITNLGTDKGNSEVTLNTITDNLGGLYSSKTAQENLLKFAKQELEALEVQCVQGEETYEQRVEKRKKEIEALKEAHNILESWRA